MIPPTQNGKFVAAMKNVISTYELRRDPDVPVIIMDEPV